MISKGSLQKHDRLSFGVTRDLCDSLQPVIRSLEPGSFEPAFGL